MKRSHYYDQLKKVQFAFHLNPKITLLMLQGSCNEYETSASLCRSRTRPGTRLFGCPHLPN